MRKTFIMFGLMCVLLISLVSALDDIEKSQRLNFGHVLIIENVHTEPSELIPGQEGKLKLTIRNNANFQLNDIRVKIDLPAELAFSNDISKKKIAALAAGATMDLEYNILAAPGTSEGIYKPNITTNYLNHIGNEREDLDTTGITVKSVPKIFVQVEETTLYQRKTIGEITLKFINNQIGDVKFLTVELSESADYEILSPSKEYVGDLDSDDFESVDFKISIKANAKDIVLPLKVTYKDTFNKEYSEDMTAYLYIPTPAEAGVKSNTTSIMVGVGVIILITAWIVYKKYKKRKNKKKG